MNYSNYRISLDVHKSSSQASLNVKREDTARMIYITLTDGGFPYQISGECYAAFTATKPDGNIVFNPCTIDGNTIMYELTTQTTAVVGRTECEIKLYGADDMLITSPAFYLFVSDTVYKEGDVVEESKDEITVLTALISDTATLIDEVQSKLDNGEFKGEKGDPGKDAEGGVKSVNGVTPDENGNVEVETLPDDTDQLEALIAADLLPATYDASGAILTDSNGNIVLRY